MPTQVQEWCGWIFDSIKLRVSCTERKWLKGIALVHECLELDTNCNLMARKLAECGGVLNHIGEVDISLRRLLHPVWSDMNNAEVYQLWQRSPHSDVKVVLSDRTRSNLKRWADNSTEPPFISLVCSHGVMTQWKPSSLDFKHVENLAMRGEVKVLETDASGKHGRSYRDCAFGKVVSGVWDSTMIHESINPKEL